MDEEQWRAALAEAEHAAANPDGRTAAEIGVLLGASRDRTLRLIRKAVLDGTLRHSGNRAITTADGRRGYSPVYRLSEVQACGR
jgi:hypothetical protein